MEVRVCVVDRGHRDVSVRGVDSRRVNELGVGSSLRAGAGRVLNSRGTVTSEISLPLTRRSREWLDLALVKCQQCHQVVE